ncbi:ComEC/Rec2 family competence protein [Geovibrio thiophilus]|uniref:ComEC/Rec2 family competence protein n=1 Tax=Geovibrio thiophilus TaxID=139438 RepID=A0A3R5YY12_9BACT|nr:ComEC/Rec2 family competence protein [Geovibrio thiophilus]QAR32226.1 ComEC/Rec2 family competence protein [Geovibrio thiophilus]
MLLHKIRMYKVEGFFFASIISAVLTAGYLYAQIAGVLIVTAVFLSRRMFAVFSFLIISLMLFIYFTVLVTAEKDPGKERTTYETTRGTVLADNTYALRAGEAVIGRYTKVPYRGREGRLAPGYLVLDKVYFRTEIPFVSAVLEKRDALSDRMYSESAGRLRIIQALLLGDKSHLEGRVQDVYLQTGLSHLLAVSGTHVGVISLICFTLLFFLPWKLRMLISCFALAAFVPLAGFKVPVMRAVVTAVTAMTAWILDCRTDFRKLLLFLWSFFLLIAPGLLGNISFLLSFSAVYGITSLQFKGLSWAEGTIKAGIAATAFTMPLSMYVFGTFNPASIFSTIVMVPVVYLQLITGFLYMLFPALTLEPLVMLEKLNIYTSDLMASLTGVFFVLKHINIYIFTGLMLFLAAVSRTKHVLLSAAVFLAVFIPAEMDDGLYFPELGRYRAFIYKDGDRVEAFYSGMRSNYLYSFMPFAAKFGVTNFDYAEIQVYDSENIIFTSAELSGGFSEICVNNTECLKPLIYMTRSNTITKSNINTEKTYFVYKNRLKADNIVELYDSAPLHYEPEGRTEK